MMYRKMGFLAFWRVDQIMNKRKKLFILITIGLLIVFVAPIIINLLVKNYVANFIIRSILVLVVIYLILVIMDYFKGKDK